MKEEPWAKKRIARDVRDARLASAPVFAST